MFITIIIVCVGVTFGIIINKIFQRTNGLGGSPISKSILLCVYIMMRKL